jgi:hypothetical protein
MLFNRNSTEWVVTPQSRAEQFAETAKTISRVSLEDPSGAAYSRGANYAEWVQACLGGPRPLSSFDYSGPFTEMVLLGTLAVRLRKKIQWDATAMKAAGAPEADALIRRQYRQGWQLPEPPGTRKRG